MLRCFRGFLRRRRERQEPSSYDFAPKKGPDSAPQLGSFTKGSGFNGSDAGYTGRESWLEIDSSGDLNLQEREFSSTSKGLGVSVRDLSLVDAQEGYKLCPVKLAPRGAAILACLEALRLVICEDRTLVLSVPSVTSPQTPDSPFSDNPIVRDLVSRLRISACTDGTAEYVDKSLPFKLVVLEWALSTAAKSLTEEVLSFERDTLPLLDSLVKKVTHQNIVSLRRAKFRMADLLARADRLRQAIEAAAEDLQTGTERRSKRPRIDSRSGCNRRNRQRSCQRPLVADTTEVMECLSLLECYGIQVEAAQSALRNVHSSAGSTEATLHLSMKLKRLRLGR